MRQRDGGNFVRPRRARQKFVPQFPRGHLDGNFGLRGERFHIGPAAKKFQPQFCRRPANQGFIRIAGAAAQLVVEMDDRKLPAIFLGK